MRLSVIIVNYNVQYFLEQCLHSVRKASRGIESEIFVVDNNSVDGSAEMVKTKFPEVKFIINQKNLGFSKANNQAIHKASGDYVLLLNPDTIVEEDTFEKVIHFMDGHPDAGGLGVKMVDGKGNFLPESKRGLPTPSVAFYKIFGLSKIFPKSKTFGKYHLGYLSSEETNEVEILSGAFMLIRKKVLDKIGVLDEAFFMYGEDIDLSYRINQAGYKNYYFAGTRIIHYKGESTKKSSVNYVVTFYNAMIIFARKHFSSKNASVFSALINLAVYFRAGIAILNRFLASALLPIMDMILLSAGVIFIKNYWEDIVIFPQGGSYPTELVSIALPLYVFLWIFSVFMSGGYDKPIKLSKIFQGLFIATIIILTIYALLPETYRFSRAIIVFGTLWGLFSMVSLRVLLHIFNFNNFKLGSNKSKRYIIVGDQDEAGRVAELLRKTVKDQAFIGLVSVQASKHKWEGFIGNFSQINDIINIYKINEVIFCARDIPAQEIIDKMAELNLSQVEFKIAPPESMAIIGSQSINTSGDIFILDLNSVSKINNRRNKRFIDLLASIAFLALSPILIFLVKNPSGFLVNIFKVLSGYKTWVGYQFTGDVEDHKLPKIRKGVLNPTDILQGTILSSETRNRLNLLYARDYKILNDINIIYKAFRNIGRN
ncbi:MAG: glycosyltransferase family 2 protein [Bacteroidales bacterium]|nr:glycosyltransferase family 2 protein [Bacteroidales bacterium]MCF8403972.1 glycosyltransferase family 2 protein [Bacteroidales bacterium]